MKTKLTTAQVLVFIGLNKQRAEVEKLFTELIQAEQEQLSILAAKYGLPEGAYTIQQEGEEFYLVPKEESKKASTKKD